MPINPTGPTTVGLDVDPFSKLDQVAAKAWKAAEKKLSQNVEQPPAQTPKAVNQEITSAAEARESLSAAMGMVSRDSTESHALDPARVAELLGL